MKPQIFINYVPPFFNLIQNRNPAYVFPSSKAAYKHFEDSMSTAPSIPQRSTIMPVKALAGVNGG